MAFVSNNHVKPYAKNLHITKKGLQSAVDRYNESQNWEEVFSDKKDGLSETCVALYGKLFDGEPVLLLTNCSYLSSQAAIDKLLAYKTGDYDLNLNWIAIPHYVNDHIDDAMIVDILLLNIGYKELTSSKAREKLNHRVFAHLSKCSPDFQFPFS